MTGKLKGFLAAAAISMGLTAPVAFAQTSGAIPPAPELIQPTEQQIDQYATAAQQVALVAAEYQPKLESANSDDQRMQIMQEADEKMVSKVQEGGLSVEDYNGISLAVQQDDQLRQQIERRISALQ